LTLVVG